MELEDDLNELLRQLKATDRLIIEIIDNYDAKKLDKLEKNTILDIMNEFFTFNHYHGYLRYMQDKQAAYALIRQDQINKEDGEKIELFTTPLFSSTINQKIINKSDIAYDKIIKLTQEPMCYVTTVCVKHMGLNDDCFELETLRNLRTWLQERKGGPELIQTYNNTAPKLVQRVIKHPSSDKLLTTSFYRIQDTVQLVLKGKNEDAVKNYVKLVHRLENEIN